MLDRFRTYDWPGNVRELRNVLERAVILAGEGTIQTGPSAAGLFRHAGSAASASTTAHRSELRIPVGSTIEQAERALIELTLEHTKNNKTRAAEILGISQKTLFNKLKEYGTQGGRRRLNVAAPPPGSSDFALRGRAGGVGFSGVSTRDPGGPLTADAIGPRQSRQPAGKRLFD